MKFNLRWIVLLIVTPLCGCLHLMRGTPPPAAPQPPPQLYCVKKLGDLVGACTDNKTEFNLWWTMHDKDVADSHYRGLA
jgi:hypothetical protein